VAELKAAGYSQRQALNTAGISRSAWQYRSTPRAKAPIAVPHSARRSAAWLGDEEITTIIGSLQRSFRKGQSVYQGFYQALDAGAPVASLSSWYRIAGTYLGPERPVRARRSHKHHPVPEVSATGPGQVWSWDITALKGPYRGVNYQAYVIIDIFSRKIIGHRVEERETEQLAKDMFTTAFSNEGTTPGFVHSDGGPSMTSKALTKHLRADHGIELSRNRPRVSNDNPFSESWFKTAKYAIGYPSYFPDLETAREYINDFITWYNAQHRHCSLEGHTPASVHDGTWITIHHHRQQHLNALATEHPQRYTTETRLKAPKAQVGINTPKSTQRLTTA
jgi:putative transposase